MGSLVWPKASHNGKPRIILSPTRESIHRLR